MVEVLIGMSLSMVVMAAVLSSYLFIGRNLVRLANQQALEAGGRRALDYFTRDVRMATGVTSASDTAVTLAVPTATVASAISYTYYSSVTVVGSVTVPAFSLVRRVGSGTPFIVVRNLVAGSFDLNYYDSNNGSITDFTDKRASIKKTAMTFSMQTGNARAGTQTPVFQYASAYLILRNKELLQ